MSDLNETTLWVGWIFTKITVKGTHGVQGRQRNQQLRHLRAEKALIRYFETLVPGVSAGALNLKIYDSQIDQLNEHIQQGSAAGRSALHLRRFLREGLTAGSSELSWSVTIPPSETKLRNSPNPYGPSSFKLIQDLRVQAFEFEKTLNADLSNQLTNAERWGQFVFSAVVLSGLSDKKALAQLPSKHLQLQWHQDYVWVDLFGPDTPDALKARRGLRRWFIDPISTILYNRLAPLPQPASDKGYWPILERSLYKFLNHIARQAKQPANFSCSKTVKTFFSAVRTHHHLFLPPYLAQYCSGEVNSSAWPEKTWLRILFSQRPVSNPEIGLNLPVEEEIPVLSVSSQSASAKQKKEMQRKILTALHKPKNSHEPSFKNVQDMLLLLQPEAEQVSILLACLLAWIKERHLKKEIRRSSAYQQLTSISNELLTAIDDRSFLSLDGEEFLGVYEDILERTPAPATRKNKADLLRRFHAYAVSAVGVPPLGTSLMQEDFFSLPDAELLTEIEYQKLYQVLRDNKHSRYGRVLLLMLILGFRCGLRISETQNIRLEDVQYRWMMFARPLQSDEDEAVYAQVEYQELTSVAATLLIRPNKYNKGKTINSQRQLPLNTLLSDDERYEFLSYHQLQRQMIGDSREHAFLFSEVANNSELLDFTKPQKTLHDVLRTLTGSPSLRYHHLRHSFTSHLLQCLNGHQAPLTINEHWQNRIINNISTRKDLFQIADFIGHSSPQVTTSHYVHNLDLLLRNHIFDYSFAHQSTGLGAITKYRLVGDISGSIAKLLGMSDENIRKRNSRYKNLMYWLPKYFEITPACDPAEWEDYPEIDLNNIAIENSLPDFTFDEWCSFLSYWRREKSRKKLCEYFRLNEQEAIKHVGVLSGLFKSKTRFKTSRTVRSDKIGIDGREYIIRPPVGTERIIAQHVFERCIRLLKNTTSEETAREGLEYFLENFRRTGTYIISRHTSQALAQLKSFEELLSRVLPNQLTYVTNLRNSSEQRLKNQGEIKIYSSKTNTASDGVAFALLIAGAVMRMKKCELNA